MLKPGYQSAAEVRQMRVLLADDRTKVRSALRLLEYGQGSKVVGEAAKADGLLAQTMATDPGLVLLDWELPGLLTDGSLSALRRACPDVCVIAPSGRPEARWAALAAGADALVSKGYPPERLLAAIDDCRRRYDSKAVL